MSLYADTAAAYARYRREDPRIAAAVHEALGDARTIVNVGAGQGAYEPRDREVTAVEPEPAMTAAAGRQAVVGVAEALPFEDKSFDAAMAVLTIHHWPDWRRGVAEMHRVARERVVIFTWDSAPDPRPVARERVPAGARRHRAARFPLPEALGEARVVEIPHDCADGFQGAYWRRPEMYLDPLAQRAISSLELLPDAVKSRGLGALRADLESGAWAERHADLLERESLDLGYRVAVSYAS